MMKGCNKKIILGLLFFIVCTPSTKSNSFKIINDSSVTISYCIKEEDKATNKALELLQGDLKKVLNVKPEVTCKPQGDIFIGTIGKSPVIDKLIADGLVSVSEIEGKAEAFQLSIIVHNKKHTLVVIGTDRRGTAYGLLEISRLMGVSPWEWWADVTPKVLKQFTIKKDFKSIQSPSVAYRGIFLNDEDWGLLPWSTKNYEPGLPLIGKWTKGTIGPKTYERIFQLLLRLRANSIWPAMHECTVPFFLVEGTREMAHNYAIMIGGSHCEPMMRSTAVEWPVQGKGKYNYVDNAVNVSDFWEKRIQEVAHMDNLYTLGMRGEHDGMMQGAKTIDEQKNVLTNVLHDQRELLKKHINTDLSKVPQIFIPYKEVLDVYNAGLSVPDDMTLMWCDDNYGYIRHFPTEEERKRKGGNGMYYHVSYWGRPHDYLWLGTASPGLLYQQMKLAYEKGIQKIWILNVGDIKPIEYQTELFMDLAWDFDKITSEGVTAHLKEYLQREFGSKVGAQLLPIMQEHYRLAYIRKPEFMGNTREEERDKNYRIVKDFSWSDKEINERLQSYRRISDDVEKITKKIPIELKDAYFELIKYPVQAAAQMNIKLLTAQLARHGKANWKTSDVAYDSIVSLTKIYNSLANGKWNLMMDHQPRRLPPFNQVDHKDATISLVEYPKPLFVFNGTEYSQTTITQNIAYGMGYDNKVLEMQQGSTVSFQLKDISTESITVEVRLLPSHPVQGNKLRFGICIDDQAMQVFEYQTVGRSEEWKENVLRNQAIRKITFPISRRNAVLKIKAIDEGVVLDQILVFQNNKS